MSDSIPPLRVNKKVDAMVDDETLQRAKQKDPLAWRLVMRLAYRRVAVVCGHELHLRDDACQRAMENINRALKSGNFHPYGTADRWVKKVATRAALDCLREARRSSYFTDVDDETYENIPIYWEFEEKLLVSDALKLLDAEPRALITLHYLDGFTYEEIGSMYGMPENTVKSKISRAIKDLRDLLPAEKTA